MNIANYYLTNPDNRKLVAPCKDYVPISLVSSASKLFLLPVLFPEKPSGQVVEAAAWVDPACRVGILALNAPQSRGISSVINDLSDQDRLYLSLYLAKPSTQDCIVVLFPKYTDNKVMYHTRFVIYEGVDIKQFFDYSSSQYILMGVPPLVAIGRLEAFLLEYPSLNPKVRAVVRGTKVCYLSHKDIWDVVNSSGN